jgi:hypothetical protein
MAKTEGSIPSVPIPCRLHASVPNPGRGEQPSRVDAPNRQMTIAQNAALSAYTYILEDGPELPKSSGPHAEVGGEVLEGMYVQGCTSIEESRL